MKETYIWAECNKGHATINFRLSVVGNLHPQSFSEFCPICQLKDDIRELKDMHVWWKKSVDVENALLKEAREAE